MYISLFMTCDLFLLKVVKLIHRLNLERLNLERPNLERPNLERLNLEWTEPRMD
jgi:hypothetical protein